MINTASYDLHKNRKANFTHHQSAILTLTHILTFNRKAALAMFEACFSSPVTKCVQYLGQREHKIQRSVQDVRILLCKNLTLRRLMSYLYGAPILDVSRSHTTTQHSR